VVFVGAARQRRHPVGAGDVFDAAVDGGGERVADVFEDESDAGGAAVCRALAMSLRWYPSSSTASSTRVTCSGLTAVSPLSTRETVV